MGKEYLWNFGAENRWTNAPISEVLERRWSELAWNFILVGDEGDTHLLPGDWDPLWKDYFGKVWGSKGGLATTLPIDQNQPNQNLTPYCQDDEACRLANRVYHQELTPLNPYFASKKYAYDLANPIYTHLAGKFTSSDFLKNIFNPYHEKCFLSSDFEKWTYIYPGLFKPNLSCAGMGQVILRQGDPIPKDSGILEPLHNRVLDIGVNFFVEDLKGNGIEEGKTLLPKYTLHHQICNGRGVFKGIQDLVFLENIELVPISKLFENSNLKLKSDCSSLRKLEVFQSIIDEVVECLKVSLQKNKYLGPVGFDGYLYIDYNHQLKFRPFVELNPRITMSIIFHHLKKRLPHSGPLLWRLYSNQHLKSPISIEQWQKIQNQFYIHSEGGWVERTSPPIFKVNETIHQSSLWSVCFWQKDSNKSVLPNTLPEYDQIFFNLVRGF